MIAQNILATMSFSHMFTAFLFSLIVCLVISECHADVNANASHISKLVIDARTRRPIPDTFFGAFFEEINHAGAGGLWAELVDNRGFEAGGSNVSSNINPWIIIGDNSSSIIVSTDRSSCFECNKVALRSDVLCQGQSCPLGGVGISNPGFWGMNIEQGKKYKVVFYVRSLGPINLQVSFIGSDDGVKLASTNISAFGVNVTKWSRMETILEANGTNHNSSLQITTSNRGVVWLDQVSAMPLDTYKGHGFRSDLYQMAADLKPKTFRFPGGCYVEGDYLRNAFRWKDTVGPWEERPGHFNDIWNYWTDDGFGYFEGLQLSEDLGAFPVWVFNSGISHHDEVNTSDISPFVQEALDGIEFARGSSTSQWGSLRASMGHPEPFDLRFVAIGNEDCHKYNYLGNYLKFYEAIKHDYPDIQIISNCDGSIHQLDHPADLYDFHIYTDSKDMFSDYTKFDNAPRSGPKAFVSEYAVWKEDAGAGSLYAAVAEAAFLIGLEKNSDIVSMVAYAPLFLNTNDRKWIPDAIVFNSYQNYGTPSYWLQQLFIESSGATLLNSTLQNSSSSIVASAIEYKNSQDGKNYLRVKVVNFGNATENFMISINGLNSIVQSSNSSMVVLTSSNRMDENSFSEPNKIVPQRTALGNASNDMDVRLPPYSVTSFDLSI
ncbi:alpha-L-arabinofuranosidase 1 isoform X4 [Medicago truncatula]|uniref:alpha-L-arabinofuranosidase 1 isoform X4 n=1 Tax=Medicago truncatula TaxID=3880 RepID=UPI0019678608|nr:alpha-L-arabinofuranosidase 1 isoform X4 [Medicago truncatula]